jgi:hypothetical protein
MASTYVNDLRLNEMATGDASGSWGTVTNTNLELIGEAFSYGTETIGDADSTLTIADGAADAARSFYLKITSSVDLTTTRIVTLAPNTVSKVWMIENATTGSQVITIKQGSGATINVPNGQVKMISTDGAGSGGAVLDLLVDVDLTGTTTLVNLDVSGAVDIAGDLTLSAGGDGALRFTAASSVKVLDNDAAALVFEEADNAYMTFVTTDGSEAVKFDKALDINAATQIDATVTVGVDDTGYDVKFFGATTGKSLLWDESADSLIVTGSTSLQGGLEVGVDDIGYDVKFFGATTGKSLLWDESADSLIVTGTTTLVGTTNLDVVDIDGAVDMASTLTIGGTTNDGTTLAQISQSGTGRGLAVNRNVASATRAMVNLAQLNASGGAEAVLDIQQTTPASRAIKVTPDGSIDRFSVYGTGALVTTPAAGGHAVFNEGGVDADFRVESATTANALFVEGSSGNVGIGTDSPFFTTAGRVSLSVNGTSSSILAFGKGGSSENYILADAGGFTIANTSATLPTTFFNNASNSMTIDSSGNVGIGVAPATRLDVAGSVNGAHATFSGQAGRGLLISTANTLSNDDGVVYNAQTAGSGKHIFQTAGTETMRIDSSGHLIAPYGITLGTAVGTYAADNTLDDYEEGTYEVVLTPSTSGSLTVAVGANTSAYTKVGQLVTITGNITVTSVSSPVGAYVDISLPFPISAKTDQAERFGSAFTFYDNSSTTFSTEPMQAITGSVVRIHKDAATWAASDQVYFSFSYTTDS